MHFLRLPVFLILLLSTSSYAEFEFSLKDLSGQQHKLSDYRGKWVLVNFWATWCPPCLAEMPELSALHDENHNIVVLGVNFWEEDLTKVRKFVDDLLLEFPILLLPKPQEIQSLGRINSLPTSVLVAPTGKVMSAFAGMVDVEAVKDFIKKH